MALHYFHCTNGEDAVFDRKGRVAGRMLGLREAAEEVARKLMRRVPAYTDWAPWMVVIYDAYGRCIDEVPFPAPLRPLRSRPSALASRSVAA